MPTVSFIIPVKPGGTVRALDNLRQLSAVPSTYEVLVAEGCRPSRQRNQAAHEAGGDILYFLDDDSRVSPDCLNSCLPLFSDPAVAVAGGPSLTPPDDTPLQQLFGQALSSPFGAGGVRNRYRRHGALRSTTDKELILCNLAIRREVFLEAGGLDERLYPNEENELLDRIQSEGGKLLHSPDMAVYRSQRPTLRQFIRQMMSYGRGRAQQTLISGNISLIGFVPLLFLLYLLALPFSTRLPLATFPLYSYLALDLVFTLAAAFSSSSWQSLYLFTLFPLMHLSNGFGLLRGLLGGKQGISAITADAPVTIRKIKAFDQNDW